MFGGLENVRIFVSTNNEKQHKMIIPTNKRGSERKLDLTNINVKDMIHELSQKNIELSISKNKASQRQILMIEQEMTMNLGAIEMLWSIIRYH